MTAINRFSHFKANHFRYSGAGALDHSAQRIRNLGLGEGTLPPPEPPDGYFPDDYTYEHEVKLGPASRITGLFVPLIFILHRVQFVHLDWMKNIGSTLQKVLAKAYLRLGVVNAPEFHHFNFRNRISNLLYRMALSVPLPVFLLKVIFLGVYFSKNKRLLEENKDLFLNAYYYHKMEMGVERKWLWQVLSPLVMMNKLAARYAKGAHQYFAGMVGRAPGGNFKEMDNQAKNRPASLLQLGHKNMLYVVKFLFKLAKKENEWAEYIETLPEDKQRIDDNFINPMYSQVEELSGILGFLNEHYSKKSIREGMLYLAREAERNLDEAENDWKGIRDCMLYAIKNLALKPEQREALEKAYKAVIDSTKYVHADRNAMRAVSHIINFVNLASYASADELWNDQNGAVYHYKEALKYGSGISEMVPDWSAFMAAWKNRNPEEAKKARQKYGTAVPIRPIL